EARLDPLPADAFDPRPVFGRGFLVLVPPSGEEGRIVRIGHADSGRPTGVADVPGQSRRGASRARGGDDPGRFRVRFERHLVEDRLGDVVVAPPVRGSFGIRELVHVVPAVLRGEAGGDLVDLVGI